MGRCKTANKGGTNLQKGTSPFPSLQDGKDGDMVQNPIEDIASGEEAPSHTSASPRMPFRFRVTSRLPSERSVSSKHWWDCLSTPKDRRCYCIQVRVMLGDGEGDQPPPPHVWEGGLITNMLQEACPEDHITKAVVLSPGEAILFFGRCSKNEWLSCHRAIDVEFGLGGPFNWARRSVQIEALRKTVQEGHHAILEAVVERKMRPGQPCRKTRHPNLSCRLWCQWVNARLNQRFWWVAKNEMMIQTTDMTKGVTTHSGGTEVIEGIGGRDPQGFPGNLQEAHHHQEETVWMDRVNAVHCIQTRKGFLGKVVNQGRLEEVLGWKLICPPLKTKRPKMQWPTTHVDGTCPCFAAPVGMTIICCPMSSGLCKDSWETWQGVWERMPPWVMSSGHWMNIMASWWPLMP